MILDASVVVAWFLPDEPLIEPALRLRSTLGGPDHDHRAPEFMWYEVGHALIRAARRSRITEQLLEIGLEAVAMLRPFVTLVDGDAAEAARIAHRLGIGVYDAAYLLAARSEMQPLVTADRHLHDAGVAGGFDVVWLGDLPTEGAA
jgi:predicted nucleic acid-binding protein